MKTSVITIFTTFVLYFHSIDLAYSNQDMIKGISKAIEDSTVKLVLRNRFEGVKQKNIEKKASALTLKSRITINTADYKHISLAIEIDNNTAFIEKYNSTRNGKTEYPLIADPEGTDINQVYLQYKNKSLNFRAGRQRVLLNNQRFIGGVAWRQNEQTYDGYRIQYQASKKFLIDYNYIYNINRLFGPKDSNIPKLAAQQKGKFHFVNSTYQFNKKNKFSGFVYQLNFDNLAALSTTSTGILYQAKFDYFHLNTSYAQQKNNGDHPKEFKNNYYYLALSRQFGKINLATGIEILTGDNGVGFSTPLATLHKFQGFSDQFLTTPKEGLKDIYISAKTKVSGIKLAAVYHDFSSKTNNIDFGTEINLVAIYPFHKKHNVVVKLAKFNADPHGGKVDVSKVWIQLQLKF
jgi:hypothetical protein